MRRHRDEFDRHADVLCDLANQIDIKANRFILVAEVAERRRVELDAGQELAARLDLRDGIFLRLRGSECSDRRGCDQRGA